MAERPEAARARVVQSQRNAIVRGRAVPTSAPVPAPVPVSAGKSALSISQSSTELPAQPVSQPKLYLRPGESPPGELPESGTSPNMTWRVFEDGKWVSLPGTNQYSPAPLDYTPAQFSADYLPKLSPGYSWGYVPDTDGNGNSFVRLTWVKGESQPGQRFTASDVQNAIGLQRQMEQAKTDAFRLGPKTNPEMLRAFGFTPEQIQHNQERGPVISESSVAGLTPSQEAAREASLAMERAGGSQSAIDAAGIAAFNASETASRSRKTEQERIVAAEERASRNKASPQGEQEIADIEDTAAWKESVRNRMSTDTTNFASSIKLQDGNYISRADWDRLSEQHKQIAILRGLDELNRAIETSNIVSSVPASIAAPVDRFASGGKLRLDLAVAAGFDNVSDYRGWNVSQAEIDRVATEQQERREAASALSDYRVAGDVYSLVDVLVSDDARAKTAANKLFTQTDIDAAHSWIDKNYGPQGRYLLGIHYIPGSTEVSKFYRAVTPWREDKGETFVDAVSKDKERVIKKLSAPVARILATGAPIATAEPTPLGEIALGLIVTGALGLAYLNSSQKETIDNSVKQLKASFQRAPTTDDVVIVSPDGRMASTATQVRQELLRVPALTPPVIRNTGTPALTPSRIDTASRPDIFPARIDRSVPGMKATELQVVYLPTPAKTKEDILGQAANVLKAQATLERATAKLTPAEIGKLGDAAVRLAYNRYAGGQAYSDSPSKLRRPPLTKGEPFEGGTAVDQARREWDQTVARVMETTFGAQSAATTRHGRRRAYEQYLAAQATLAAAKRSYVASVNPQPVMGTSTDASLSAYIALSINKLLNMEITTRQATEAATTAYNQALSRGATASQARVQANNAAREATIQSVKASGLTSGMSATKANSTIKAMADVVSATATNTATNAATNTASATKTSSASMTNSASAMSSTSASVVSSTATSALAMEATSSSLLTPRPKLPLKDGAGSPKTEDNSEYNGALAWPQGELKAGTVVHLVKQPYASQSDVKTVVGEVPKGAVIVSGKGAPQRGIRVIAGTAPKKPVSIDMGVTDVLITPIDDNNVSISFKPDPKQRTRSQLRIGKKPARPKRHRLTEYERMTTLKGFRP